MLYRLELSWASKYRLKVHFPDVHPLLKSPGREIEKIEN